ncbi:ATP-binding cassette permease [Martiniozyma asiatica (nom. inval.)]|nr:ATP-binding cassette permease [Martiniozyma asiatica]
MISLLGPQLRAALQHRAFLHSSIRPLKIIYPKPSINKRLFISTRQLFKPDKTEFKSESESQNGSNNSNNKENKKGSMKEILSLLKLTKPELPTLSLALLFLCVSSAVSMLFPSIMGKIIDTAKNSDDSKTDETIGEFSVPGNIDILGYDIPINLFYGGLLCIFAVGSMANFGRVVLLRKVGERIMAKLRLDIERNIFYQSAKFWDTHKSGDLISRLVNDSTVVTRSVTQNLSDGMRSTISGFVGLGMMIGISIKLTGYMFLLFPILIGIAFVFGRRVKKVSKEIQTQLGALTRISEEQFSFVKTIQSFNNEKYEVSKFGKEVKKLYDLSVYEGKLNGYFYSGNGFIGNTFLVFLLSVGVWMVRNGELTIGELSSYLMYTIYSASSVYSLSNFYSELMKGVGASERVFDLLKLEPEIHPEKGVVAPVGDVIFKNVDFTYPTRENHKVFSNFNLTIKEGDNICFVGPSGCGKSSVGQLLLRYYEPTNGQVIVNGHNLNSLCLKEYRKQVGFVQQEPMLFSGTLRENISYGRQDASEADILKVCDLANCTTFISKFPDGLDTIIGSKGAQLSGGQKQRVALARALLLSSDVSAENLTDDIKAKVCGDAGILLGPKILILDEATSALDVQSEQKIHQTLKLRDAVGLTTISVAHRESTIRMSRRVVVFGDNGISQDGDVSVVMGEKGEGWKLMQKQK